MKVTQSRIGDVVTRMGWQSWFSIKAKGSKGGLALIWLIKVDIQVLRSSDQIIHCRVRCNMLERSYLFIGLYGFPYAKDKTQL